MTSTVAAFTSCPGEATFPSTDTRPAMIRASAFRREVNPLRAMTRCNRSGPDDGATLDGGRIVERLGHLPVGHVIGQRRQFSD